MPHVDEGTLHAYLDGELPSAERKTLEAHLAECASCRAMMAEERALLERASALLGSARPPERATPPFEPRRSPWRVRTPVAWAASIALALGVGYYLHEPGTSVPSAAVVQRHDEPASQLTYAAPQEDKPAPAPTQPRRQARTPASSPATPPPRAEARADERPQDSDAGRALEEATVAAAARERDSVMTKAAAPQLRNSAAAAPRLLDSTLALDAIVVRSANSGGMQLNRGLTTTTWPIISSGTARSLLGTEPVGLPGLARQIRRSPVGDGTVVVEQKIDSKTTVQIFQRQTTDAHFDSSPTVLQGYAYGQRDSAAAERLARYVGRLRVEISGPLTTDSLNKLLDRLEPLP